MKVCQRRSCLAPGTDEFLEQILPHAVEARDFGFVRPSLRRRVRLDFRADRGELPTEPDELLELVCTNAIKPGNFGAGRLRLLAPLPELMSNIITNLNEGAFQLLVGGREGEGQSANSYDE